MVDAITRPSVAELNWALLNELDREHEERCVLLTIRVLRTLMPSSSSPGQATCWCSRMGALPHLLATRRFADVHLGPTPCLPQINGCHRNVRC